MVGCVTTTSVTFGVCDDADVLLQPEAITALSSPNAARVQPRRAVRVLTMDNRVMVDFSGIQAGSKLRALWRIFMRGGASRKKTFGKMDGLVSPRSAQTKMTDQSYSLLLVQEAANVNVRKAAGP